MKGFGKKANGHPAGVSHYRLGGDQLHHALLLVDGDQVAPASAAATRAAVGVNTRDHLDVTGVAVGAGQRAKVYGSAWGHGDGLEDMGLELQKPRCINLQRCSVNEAGRVVGLLEQRCVEAGVGIVISTGDEESELIY